MRHRTWLARRPATWRTPSARMQQLGTPTQPGTSTHRKNAAFPSVSIKLCVQTTTPRQQTHNTMGATSPHQHRDTRRREPKPKKRCDEQLCQEQALAKQTCVRFVDVSQTLYCDGLACVAAMSSAIRCGTSNAISHTILVNGSQRLTSMTKMSTSGPKENPNGYRASQREEILYKRNDRQLQPDKTHSAGECVLTQVPPPAPRRAIPRPTILSNVRRTF